MKEGRRKMNKEKEGRKNNRKEKEDRTREEEETRGQKKKGGRKTNMGHERRKEKLIWVLPNNRRMDV